jgi:hypothetical protein
MSRRYLVWRFTSTTIAQSLLASSSRFSGKKSSSFIRIHFSEPSAGLEGDNIIIITWAPGRVERSLVRARETDHGCRPITPRGEVRRLPLRTHDHQWRPAFLSWFVCHRGLLVAPLFRQAGPQEMTACQIFKNQAFMRSPQQSFTN